MQLAWAELAKHVGTDNQWLRVWTSIVFAKTKSIEASRFRKQRSKERDAFLALARKFATLARVLENGPLDVLAYELFPKDVIETLGIPNWSDMEANQRSDVAHQLLSCWPSTPELLSGLEERALSLADNAMNIPRPDDRSSGDVAARTFVWYLGQNFRQFFGIAMIGTLAKIATVTFNNGEEISRGFVQSALKGV